jgi:NTP pyrophosphatase (non-canonical NTP hydrolase)
MKTTEEKILQFATEQWGPKDLSGLVMKLAEECGEIAGACVKIPEGRSTFEDLDKELGDALIVLSQFAAQRETTLEELRAERFAQIQERAKKRGCAACDRGDFSLGHADSCPHADVDLPDTAAQDSASKSNSPAVSG